MPSVKAHRQNGYMVQYSIQVACHESGALSKRPAVNSDHYGAGRAQPGHRHLAQGRDRWVADVQDRTQYPCINAALHFRS